MAEVNYYFDGSEPGEAWVNAYRMNDNDLGTFAYIATDGAIQTENSNTCPGTDLGTITKVELRCYGYGDGDDRIDLMPFATEYQLVMPSSVGWSTYADITPEKGSWVWNDIVVLDCVVEYDKVGKANTMYCAKVEIRVTYTPPTAYPYRRHTLQEPTHSGRRGFDETTGHRRGYW